MSFSALITNTEPTETRSVRIAVFPAPSEEAGEMQEETRVLGPGEAAQITLPDDRAVRLLAIPATEG